MPTAVSLEERIWEVLGTIEDPELPITVIDLGMVQDVAVQGDRVRVTLVPTYSACPAVEVMRQEIRSRLGALPGVAEVQVELSFAEPWTLARMTVRGRERLLRHGLSVAQSRLPTPVVCPFCGSTNTALENPFGPTLCRAVWYCRDCRNPIERFKPPAED